MELSVRGWHRDHGETVIKKRDLATAEIGSFNSYSREAIYISAGPTTAETLSPNVEIRFDARVVLNGDYQVRVALTKREISSLFFLLNSESSLDDLVSEFVCVRRLQDAGPLPSLPNLPFPEIMLKRLDDMEFSVRTSNILKNDGLEYVGDLAQKSVVEMLRTPGFGRRSVNEVIEKFAQMGLSLETHIPSWPPENIKELSKRFKNLNPD